MTGRRYLRGFTLVEMLVALLLLSLLTVVIGGGLNLGIRSWEGMDRHQQTESDAFLVQQALRRLLGAANRSVVNSDDKGRQLAFHGSAEELIWVAPLQQNGGGDDLYWIWLGRLDSRPPDEPEGLYLAYEPYSGVSEEDLNQTQGLSSTQLNWALKRNELMLNARKSLLMAGRFDEFSLSYLKTEPDRPSTWEPEWVYQDSLPSLISVQFKEGEVAPWPTLMVRPKADAYVAKRAN